MEINPFFFDENSTLPPVPTDVADKKAYSPVIFDTDKNAPRPHSYRDAKPYRVEIKAIISHDTD